MPRTIEVSARAGKIDQILLQLQKVEGIAGIRRHRQVSLDPPGDLLVIQATNDATRRIFEEFSQVEQLEEASISTSEPRSLLSPSSRRPLDVESSETTLDEVAFHLRHETNVTQNYLILMTLAGAIAATGLWTDKLHLIIGAMIIAPAFEPFVRVAFGVVVGPWRMMRGGFVSLAAGYLALAIGALLAVLALAYLEPTAPQELSLRQWVKYWSTTNASAVLASSVGAIGGVIVVCGLRAVLTTGVMIALALIPSMSVVGMALGLGEFPLASRALLRWAVDAGLILLAGVVVIGLKKRFRFRGKSLS